MQPRVPAPLPESVEARRSPPADDWQAIGEAFETMGKVALAMTVGFTAGALFCRWAEQRKLKSSSVKEVLERLS